MSAEVAGKKTEEARLWASALTFSIFLHVLLLSGFGLAIIHLGQETKTLPPQPLSIEPSVQIFPDMIQEITPPKGEAPPEAPPKLARTSADQETNETPASRRYIGERNTRATSDRAPTADTEAPSQAGREPEPGEAPETTQSRYQDGRLDQASTPPTPPSAEPAPLVPPTPDTAHAETVQGEKTTDPGEAEKAQTAIREPLLDGPNPVETPVPKSEIRNDIKPREETQAKQGDREGIAEKKDQQLPKPKPAPASDPAFSGNQTKTAIVGNISRTGRSALDVVDSPMGRYQAQISRAVEREWQRNCVKHRDFITPGFLTVRFFVTESGRVRSVQFIGDSQTGEVQKGFTLNSIRNAPLPAMPPAVKKEMGGDALELIFNFYF